MASSNGTGGEAFFSRRTYLCGLLVSYENSKGAARIYILRLISISGLDRPLVCSESH